MCNFDKQRENHTFRKPPENEYLPRIDCLFRVLELFSDALSDNSTKRVSAMLKGKAKLASDEQKNLGAAEKSLRKILRRTREKKETIKINNSRGASSRCNTISLSFSLSLKRRGFDQKIGRPHAVRRNQPHAQLIYSV